MIGYSGIFVQLAATVSAAWIMADVRCWTLWFGEINQKKYRSTIPYVLQARHDENHRSIVQNAHSRDQITEKKFEQKEGHGSNRSID
jgi:hypothetical protein